MSLGLGLVRVARAGRSSFALLPGNLLLQPDSFGDAPWAAGGGGGAVVTAGAAGAPDGSSLASTLEDTNTGGLVGRAQSVVIVPGTTAYTVSAYYKAGTSSVASLRAVLSGGTSVPGEAVINLATGAVQWRTANVGTALSSADVGGGWWRVSVTVTGNGTANNSLGVEVRPAFAATYSPTSSAAATGTIYAWRAQAVVGP